MCTVIGVAVCAHGFRWCGVSRARSGRLARSMLWVAVDVAAERWDVVVLAVAVAVAVVVHVVVMEVVVVATVVVVVVAVPALVSVQA